MGKPFSGKLYYQQLRPQWKFKSLFSSPRKTCLPCSISNLRTQTCVASLWVSGISRRSGNERQSARRWSQAIQGARWCQCALLETEQPPQSKRTRFSDRRPQWLFFPQLSESHRLNPYSWYSGPDNRAFHPEDQSSQDTVPAHIIKVCFCHTSRGIIHSACGTQHAFQHWLYPNTSTNLGWDLPWVPRGLKGIPNAQEAAWVKVLQDHCQSWKRADSWFWKDLERLYELGLNKG